MNDVEFDYLVFIGRFQPFHAGHQTVVQKALEKAKTVILLCGSADTPRTLRNPWSVEERESMIRLAFDEADNQRIVIQPIHDEPYDDNLWLANVHQAVRTVVGEDGYAGENTSLSPDLSPSPTSVPGIGLIGHLKDNSSYYLKLFPQWALVSVDNVDGINATDIRRQYFRLLDDEEFTNDHLPEAILQWLGDFRHREAYQYLQREQRHIDHVKDQWAQAPYAPIFVTTDALVIQAAHVLLVKRKHHPGKGLWALPGGFIDPEEWLFDGCVRELVEETNLRIDKDELTQLLRDKKVYDAPQRSARGRTITHVFYFQLPTADTLTPVLASDDAETAFWQPIRALDRQQFFEDHYDIIQDMLKDD